MKSVAIFIVLLIGVAYGSQSGMTTFLGVELNFSPKRSIFNLLTQIEAKLKVGGPLDSITKMLDEFKQTITNEQIQHDNLFARQQKSCDEEISFREKEIADATGALKAAQETLDGCKQQQVRAVGDLANTKTQQQETSTYLVTIQETRKRDNYNYETQVTALKQLQTLYEECLIFVEQLIQGEASFVQIAQHTNKILKTAVATKQTNGLAPLLQVLVQLATSTDNVDEQAFQRVKDLINNLLQKTIAEIEAVVAAENAAQEAFNTEEARVKEILVNLQNAINALEIEIAQLDKCIITQTGIVQSATAKLERNTVLKADADALCQACVDEYNSSKKARTGELALLQAIRERVEARFAQLSSGVTERGKQDTFEYNAENDYEQKEFVASNAQ